MRKLILLLVTLATSLYLQRLPAAADKSEVLGVGASIQDFGLRSIDVSSGELKAMHWLSDYVGSQAKTPKRVLVLSFYATWCKACIAEMPALQRMQDTYASQGLQVLGINVRSKHEDTASALTLTRKLLSEHAVSYPVLFDRYTHRNQLLYLGDAALLPCNILIDHTGKIVARFQGAEGSGVVALEAAVKQLLLASPPAPVSSEARP